MKHFENVLLAVDVASSDFGREGGVPRIVRAAAAQARWVAEVSGARVTLMTVVAGGDVDARSLDGARKRLVERVVPLLGGAEPEIVVGSGTPFVRLVQQVLRDEHDLLIVGARRSGNFEPTIAGSTSIRLIHNCPCPVWIAPRVFEDDERIVLSAVALHELSPRVVELSASVVDVLGGKWNVLHVPQYPLEGAMRLRDAEADEVAEYEKSCRDEAWTQMHALCDPVAKRLGVEPKMWMAEGLASEQIVMAARQLHADLVVMGTIGRSGLAGHVIGNTAERVFAKLDCSVLAVKPSDFRCPVTLDD
ncbi:MAG: universal stress protein [Planctomycetes bacterium]|nr:universal stress protein [Planctomycetota bacterium]